MKKFLLLSILVQCAAVAYSQTAVFDFTSAEALKPANVNNIECATDGRVSLAESSFASGPVILSFDGNAEWYHASRLNLPGYASLIFKAKEGSSIKSIVLDASGLSMDNESGSDMTTVPAVPNGFTWDTDNATFKATGDNSFTEVSLTAWGFCKIEKITVEYKSTGGIDMIVTDRNDAPVEYFNALGRRVSGDNLAPGLYIRRQGNHASKIFVK